MLQHSQPPVPPAIFYEGKGGALVINEGGRTTLRIHRELPGPWHVQILRGGTIHDDIPCIGPLSRVLFTALILCCMRGFVRPPGRTKSRYRAVRCRTMTFAYAPGRRRRRTPREYLAIEVGCGCRHECTRHRPTLTLLRHPGGIWRIVCFRTRILGRNNLETLCRTFELLCRTGYL